MEDLSCPFRLNVRMEQAGNGRPPREVATCGFALQLVSATDARSCTVDRSACEYCGGGMLPDPERMNEVLPHVVFSACSFERANGRDDDKLEMLESWSSRLIEAEAQLQRKSQLYGCDVIVGVTENSPQTVASIESILQQEHCIVVLHLINTANDTNSAGVIELMRRYDDDAKVVCHVTPVRRGVYHALHHLLPNLHTQFVAIQNPATVSMPRRLTTALKTLEDKGFEFFASHSEFDGQTLYSHSFPADTYARSIRTETLVMRRAALIDMGGIADRDGDADLELIFRAEQEDRDIIVVEQPLVRWQSAPVDEAIGPTPQYAFGEPSSNHGSLRQHAIGFSCERAACDVVLPFRGHLNYVEEALNGLLEQEDADIVIHLVDDCTQDDTTAFLNRWKAHSLIRTYRNRRNIGQFASFNNVSRWLETDLVAVQDGDDISLPHRIAHSANMLRLSGADLFGAATTLFGNEEVVEQLARKEIIHQGQPARARLSTYAKATMPGYFLENPTIVMRRALFENLGGYCDYGTPARNRTGIDTEFMVRAYLANARIAVSRDVVLRYRCHASSATQQEETGFQSTPRQEAGEETVRRREYYVQHRFDPRLFGALRRTEGITERV